MGLSEQGTYRITSRHRILLERIPGLLALGRCWADLTYWIRQALEWGSQLSCEATPKQKYPVLWSGACGGNL